MQLLSKTVQEFGQTVTLYRVANDQGKGTLWHRDADKAWEHWQRLAPLRGW